MRVLAAITLTILISVIAGCAGRMKSPEADLTDAKPPAEWEKGPTEPGPGLNGPSIIPPGGTAFPGSISLGGDSTQKGHPENTATVPAFNCTGDKQYCEILFKAQALLRDNEQLRVKMSAGPTKNAIGYIKTTSGFSTNDYRLSLAGACGDDITVTFDWGKTGDNPASIASEAHIVKVEYSCVQTDQTNKEAMGKLFDSNGNKLNE